MKKIVVMLLCLTLVAASFTAVADEESIFILCNPKTPVNVRKMPKKGSEVSGRLDFGDSAVTDGVKKNGYLHILGITEDGEGWIFAGYAIEDQPVKLEDAWANIAATGRVMSYRWVDGRRRGWVNVCTQVKVLAISEEWAVTDHGYIRMKYLEVWYE